MGNTEPCCLVLRSSRELPVRPRTHLSHTSQAELSVPVCTTLLSLTTCMPQNIYTPAFPPSL